MFTNTRYRIQQITCRTCHATTLPVTSTSTGDWSSSTIATLPVTTASEAIPACKEFASLLPLKLWSLFMKSLLNFRNPLAPPPGWLSGILGLLGIVKQLLLNLQMDVLTFATASIIRSCQCCQWSVSILTSVGVSIWSVICMHNVTTP